MKLANIASLDPDITASGRKGSLPNVSTNDRALWSEMHEDWEQFVNETQDALASFGLTTDEESAPPPGNGEDRLVTRKERIDRRFFRDTLLSAYDRRCCVSGLSNPHLLTPSHIAPWREDRKNRLNPRNGLLLSVLHDRAFDAGLMSVADDYTVLVCKSVRSTDKDRFLATTLSSCHGRRIKLPTKFLPDQDLLAYHRRSVFRG